MIIVIYVYYGTHAHLKFAENAKSESCYIEAFCSVL